MNLLRTIAPALLAGALVVVGCSDDEFEFPVEVEVRAGSGGGVAGATLKMGAAEGEKIEIGRTGADGRFTGVFKGVAGEEAVLEVVPPDDYKLGADGGQFKVQLGTTETDDGVAPQTLAFQAALVPTTLEYVVLVTSPGKFRPIRLGEDQVARTSSRGAAAVHLRAKPGDEVTIKVEPRAREKQLGKTFTVTEADRILQVSADDTMEETAAEKETREGRPPRAAGGGGGGRGGGDGDDGYDDDGGGRDDVDPLDIATGDGGGEPSKDDKAAAKEASKAAGKAAKVAKAAAKAAGASSKKVAKVMKKFPGAQEVGDASAGASAAKEAANRAGDAAKAASAAAKAADRMGAEDAQRDAEDSQRAAEEEASRVAALVDDAKRRLSEEADALREEAAQAKEQLGDDRVAWAADAQAAVDGALSAAAEAKSIASDAKKLAKKAKKEKKAASKAAKMAAKAYKAASKAAARIKKLPGKAKKAGVGGGDAIISKAQDGQRAAEDALADAKAALADVERAAEADSGGAPVGDGGGKEVASVGAGTADDIIDGRPKKCPKGKKRNKKGKCVKRPAAAAAAAGPAEDEVECTLDAVTEGLEAGDMAPALLKSCLKVKGVTDAPDICLKIAKYWFSKRKWKKQAKALECATGTGRYKYDPNILYSLIKTYLKLGRFRKAEEPFERFLSQKQRLPASQRKAKVCEMYSLFAQTKEQIFYKEQEEDPEADNLPLLEKAIDYWQRYQSYCSADPKSKKAINALKKMKEELVQ